MNRNRNQDPKFQFNPDHLEEVACDECKNDTFEAATMLYKLPKLASPDGHDKYLPTSVWKCTKCGHMNEDIPDSLSNQINASLYEQADFDKMKEERKTEIVEKLEEDIES